MKRARARRAGDHSVAGVRGFGGSKTMRVRTLNSSKGKGKDRMCLCKR